MCALKVSILNIRTIEQKNATFLKLYQAFSYKSDFKHKISNTAFVNLQ